MWIGGNSFCPLKWLWFDLPVFTLPFFDGGNINFGNLLGIAIKPELRVVGNDKVRESKPVSVELLLVFGIIEILSDGFRFNITKWTLFFGEDIIRRTTLDAFRFIGNGQLWHHARQ